MTDEQIATYKRDGAVLLKGFFDKVEIAKLRDDAKEVFSIQLRNHGLLGTTSPSEEEFEHALYKFFDLHFSEFTNCGKQIQHLISLHRLSLDARILAALADLGMAFPNISTRPVLFFNSRHLAKEEVYWRVFAHQDWRSMQGSLDATVVWVPLMDIDAALGAIEVVPGSHRRGLLTTEVVNGFGKVEGFGDSDFV